MGPTALLLLRRKVCFGILLPVTLDQNWTHEPLVRWQAHKLLHHRGQQARMLKVNYFLGAGCTTAETKHVKVSEGNEEHRVQIKNTHYCCIYLTCVLYYFNKLNVNFFFTSWKIWHVAYSEGWGIWENTVFKLSLDWIFLHVPNICPFNLKLLNLQKKSCFLLIALSA
jgi:hypothetical protein